MSERLPSGLRSAKKSCGISVPRDRRLSSSGDISWESLRNFTTFAVEAQYGRHQFLKENKTLRLATLIVDFNAAFSESLEQRGHAVNFCETTFSPSKSPRKINTMRSRKLKLEGYSSKWSGEEKLVDGKDDRSMTIEPLEYPELINILPTVSTPVLYSQRAYWSRLSGNTSRPEASSSAPSIYRSSRRFFKNSQ